MNKFNKVISPYKFITDFFKRTPEAYEVCFEYYKDLEQFREEMHERHNQAELLESTLNQQLFSADRFSEFMEICKRIFLDLFLSEKPSLELLNWLASKGVEPEQLEILGMSQTIRGCAEILKTEDLAEVRTALAVYFDRKAIQKTGSFLDQVQAMSQELLSEFENHAEYSCFLENFHGTVQLFAYLFNRKFCSDSRVEDSSENLFRYTFNLVSLMEKDPYCSNEGERPFSADSSFDLISDSEIEIAWERVSTFCRNYHEDLSITEDLFQKFKDSNNEKTTYRCLFTIDDGNEAVVQNCKLYFHFSEQPDVLPRINKYICLNLDESGKPLAGYKINKMLETAVKDALACYATKKNNHRFEYDHLNEVKGNVDTLFYSVGDDAFNWYQGQSIGAAAFCATLSVLSGDNLPSDTYYTGRTGNRGHENIDVRGVEAKYEAVRNQRSIKNEYKTFVIPDQNYEMGGYANRDTLSDDNIEIVSYSNDKALFDIWYEKTITEGISKRDIIVVSEIEKLLSADSFVEREHDASGRLVNSLLRIISNIAPNTPIDLRLLEPGLEEIQKHIEQDILPLDDVERLLMNTDGSLENSFGYLIKNDSIWGTFNAIHTIKEVQLRIKDELGSPKVNQVSLIITDLLKGTLDHALYKSTINDKQSFEEVRNKLNCLIPHIAQIVSDSAKNERNPASIQKLIETMADIQIDLLISNIKNSFIENGELINSINEVVSISQNYIEVYGMTSSDVSPLVTSKTANLEGFCRIIEEGYTDGKEQLQEQMIRNLIVDIRSITEAKSGRLKIDNKLYKILSDLSYLTENKNISRGFALTNILIDYSIYKIKLQVDHSRLNRAAISTELKFLKRLYQRKGHRTSSLDEIIRELREGSDPTIRKRLATVVKYSDDNRFLK